MSDTRQNNDAFAPLELVITTCANDAQAESLAQILLDKKLAACVSIAAQVVSHYTWQGQRERSEERLLFIKTPHHLLEPLASCIRENHPYEAPEILALPVRSLSPAYNCWVRQVCLPEMIG
jgi:periplasmic divalent cation tolerance protein